MKKRKIKNTDLEIAPICFGGNVFGWTLDEKQSFEILDKFVSGGYNFIDTADTYSWWVNGIGGQSETIIGKWLKARGNRQDVILATKVGSENKEHPVDVSKKHILESVDASLKRLQTDYIDLYYTHFDDEVTPVEETLEAYDEIIKAGKVRYIAASNVSPARLKESFKVAEEKNLPRYVALQPHYNLIVRDQFEKEYAPVVRQFDLSVFTYWSLESGFLSGKYKTEADFDKTARGASIKKYFDAHGKKLLAALRQVADKHGVQPATVSLAWLLAHPLVTAPIVSATKDSHLKAMFAATDLVLDQEDMDLLG
ncbi:aldo/keto reductase [Prevotella cerevisiae]|jgi:aryl-alcohol dehydrogenase-like predicted oxidoreductase|uniref:Aldo/keto reductase n=1 Tax=Segatella cerevisiae TaxID=2053716 RepID=A0ABT1C1G1_9BACT|nr:aldo/keto reductase [Segatella cerevisiae]MCH3994832.1 aldo/keto reductase [Prevotella sp.]MCO6026458.1 aldo/keto reductase [Segatella cerevisiae]